MQVEPRVSCPCLCLSCHGMCWGLAQGPQPGAALVMGKGRDVASANVGPGSLQLWLDGCDPSCQQKDSRTHTGAAQSWAHAVLALSRQTWQQGSPFGVRQSWELLAAVFTTTLLGGGLGWGGVCLSLGAGVPGH